MPPALPGDIYPIVVFCKLVNTKAIVTIHGSISRFFGWNRFAIRAAIVWADTPIVLNQSSLVIATQLNPKARLISAFLPELEAEILPSRFVGAILRAKRGKSRVLITSAFDCVYDSEGREIYGILSILEFYRDADVLVVVSDPSGNYERAARGKFCDCHLGHVLFLTGPHSFVAALQFADAYVRNTITDGDSLSVHEALSCGKEVWATNVVERPEGANTYKELEEISLGANFSGRYVVPCVGSELIDLYAAVLLSCDSFGRNLFSK